MAKSQLETKAKTKQRTHEVRPGDLTNQIRAKFEERGKNFADIARLMYHSYSDGEGAEFKGLGHEDFKTYANKEFDLDYRKAMHYVQVGGALVKFNITDTMLGDIGWTKFKEISYLFHPEMTQKEIESYISKAAKMNFEKVRDFVKSKRSVTVGGERVEKEKLSFTLTGDQIGTVNLALDKAMRAMNTTNPNLALEYICMEWYEVTNPENLEILKERLGSEEEEVEAPKAPYKERADKGKSKGKKGKTEVVEDKEL